jgi:hypothetical protein
LPVAALPAHQLKAPHEAVRVQELRMKLVTRALDAERITKIGLEIDPSQARLAVMRAS